MNRHRIGKDWRGSFKAGHSLQRKFVGRTEAEPLPTWGWPIARHGPDVPVISSYLPPGQLRMDRNMKQTLLLKTGSDPENVKELHLLADQRD